MILVIDDDEIMAECIARACGDKEVRIFTNAIEAMKGINELGVPELIFLDILLNGPDGFTFLHELVSYSDTAKIPVVIVSSFDYELKDVAKYGAVGILNKDRMLPEEIWNYAKEYAE